MTYSELGVVVPSRGRPDNIRRLLQAWRDTAQFASLIVVVDSDDPRLDGYLELKADPALECVTIPADAPPRCWSLSVQAPARLGETLNRTLPGLSRYFPAVGFMGDDHLPRTAGWDRLICNVMQPAGTVYGNDLLHGEAIPTACFWDAVIPRTLGRVTVPGQIHLWMDNYWKTLGERIGRLVYLERVVIEHLHPVAGKAEWDDSYRRSNDDLVSAHDRDLYLAWDASGQLAADAESVLISTARKVAR